MTQLLNILKALERLTFAISDIQASLNLVQASDARRNAIHGVTAAKALSGLTDRELIYLSYLTVEGDNMGGFFEFSAASTATPDDVDTIQPNDVSGAGRLIRRI